MRNLNKKDGNTKTIKRTLTLQYTTSSLHSRVLTDEALMKMLSESKKVQQNLIKDNKTYKTHKTNYSNTSARGMKLRTTAYSKDRLVKSKLEEIDRAEAYRILVGYQQRLAIARYLKKHNWEVSYKDRPESLKYTKLQYWLNVQRARALPALPEIKSVRFPTNKADNQLLKISFQDKKILVRDFKIWNSKVDLEFIISTKQYTKYNNIMKISRPTVFLKDNKIYFDFTVFEEVESKVEDSEIVLGVDLGVVKPISLAKVSSSGGFSRELECSGISKQLDWQINRLNTELFKVSCKNRRRAVFGIINESAVEQERLLRIKRKRLQELLDWNLATDILGHSEPSEKIVLEKLNFGLGGGGNNSRRFRHSSVTTKVAHKAGLVGKTVKLVSAKDTSQLCPICMKRVVHKVSSRLVECVCGWVGDRDYTGSLNVGKKELGIKKLDRSKLVKTSKRPRFRKKKQVVSLDCSVSVGAVSTGICFPSEVTESIALATLFEGSESSDTKFFNTE